MTLNERVILITGASRGIGKATALRLAREGARLALCGRDDALLRAVAEESTALGARCYSSAFDLRDESAILDFLTEAKTQLGPLDAVINNAGYNHRKALLTDVSTAEFDDMIAVNLRAPFVICREALRGMAERGGGHIVNVLSTVCHLSMETMGAYTASKRGFEGLSGVLLKEARALGVRVANIYPGGTDTDFREAERPDYMRPESVAELIHAVLTLPDDLVVQSVTFRPMVESNF